MFAHDISTNLSLWFLEQVILFSGYFLLIILSDFLSIELFIHIDRCGNKAVYNAAHDYKWPCGPTTVTNKPVKRGMREMWFDTWELVQERHEKNGEVCRRPRPRTACPNAIRWVSPLCP